ncbi:MAG: MFS transporter [Gammaproteobacteria bacterium]|nr:MFS transporter [Gammaproteobacteria bacterium]
MHDTPEPTPEPTRRAAYAWACYDWANSAFATTVMAGFFPLFFKQYWNSGVADTLSTFRLGMANSIASLIVVLGAPLLGAIADHMDTRKGFLLLFSALGVVMTGSLYFVAAGDWQIAALCYVLAVLGFSGGNLFYDSLLIFVARPTQLDRISALGFALGYLGGGVLFAVNVLMVLHPDWFGLPDKSAAVRTSFLTVAVWWAVFTVPVLMSVHEPRAAQPTRLRAALSQGFGQLRHTLRDIGRLPQTFLFLLAYWLYIDGVDTIIRMAVDYGLSLGFPSNSLIVALLITQFVGFPAAIAFGRIGERIGARTGILIALAVYMVVTAWGAFMSQVWEFYLLAVVIGLVQGGVQSLSRSLYARLIPAGRSAEFFGFYNMLGKFAAVLGPALMGWVGVLTGNPRLGILSVLVLFVLGAALLTRVDLERGRQNAMKHG